MTLASSFTHYWNWEMVSVNLLILVNLAGALLLGMLVGYERAYNGRAAGMRTYGLICMASAAFTVFVGYSESWYGRADLLALPDATRVIQGIITGVGFLCAGVIMRDGFTINGLTTAASMWASSAIGVLVGVGFYTAAIGLACLSMLSMTLGHHVQRRLPQKESLLIELHFKEGVHPNSTLIERSMSQRGFELQTSTLVISRKADHVVWRFVVSSGPKNQKTAKTDIAHILSKLEPLSDFSIETSRH